MRLPLPLGRNSAKAVVPLESVERLVNAYLDAAPEGKEPTPVYGTGGLAVWASGLNGGIRGGLEMGGVPYAVMGTKLYRFAQDGTATDLGTIPNADDVGMAGDGTNVVVVTNGAIYVWNGATLGLVTDPDAPDASSVVYIDGYFLFGIRNSQEFAISALADPTNYDALDFAAAEWKPDNLITPVVVARTVYMMGAKTAEAQQNTGAADFPFQRYQDLFVDVGIAGRFAYATTNTTMFWLADDNTVRRLDGITPTKVSNAWVAKIIKGWSDQSLTVGSAHVVGDHLFIVFRNPDGCVVFDQTTGRWHERESFGSATWRAKHYINAYGLHLYGDATTGKIYRHDEDLFDEAGELLVFEMITPWAYAQNKRFTAAELEVVVQAGVGTPTLDPAITCERTKDGTAFAGFKRKTLGRQGALKRVLFGSQGQARQMAFRLRISDPVRRAVLGAYVEIDAEAA